MPYHLTGEIKKPVEYLVDTLLLPLPYSKLPWMFEKHYISDVFCSSCEERGSLAMSLIPLQCFRSISSIVLGSSFPLVSGAKIDKTPANNDRHPTIITGTFFDV